MVVAGEPLSFEAYRQLDASPDDRFELVNGTLKRMNPPKTQHFFMAKWLERQLEDEIRRVGQPWVCLPGAGVRTGLAKSRLADLMVLDREAAIALWEESAIFQVTPRMVIEIVSPSSITDDYRYKRMEYGAIEVPEYWIIDPMAERVTLLQLVEGLYEEVEYAGDTRLASAMLPELSVTMAQILAAGSI